MDSLVLLDADSHIEEGPDVFKHLERKYADRRPQIVDVGYTGQHKLRDKAWLVDGRIIPHPFGHSPVNFATPATMEWAKRKPVSVESQMLSPAVERVADLDRMNISKQVNYPTLFLEHVTYDPEFEAALWCAWNRWVAESVAAHKDRLKWVVMVPFWHPQTALRELQFGKEHGAVGVYAMGTIHDKLLNDRLFDPVYGLCEEMNLPICIHIAWAHRAMNQTCDSLLAAQLFTFEQSLLHGFYAFVSGGVLERFRKLRVGIFEGYIGHYMTMLKRIAHWSEMDTARPLPSLVRPQQYLEEGRVYFSCDGDEPALPEFIRVMGQEHVMMMADFPHVHYEGDHLAGGVAAFRAREDLSPELKRLLAVDNAARFYGI